MTKVSVIIPFYNQKKEFIEQSILSVLNQTLTDLEVICIDDGSENEECINYISFLRTKDKRIKIIRKNHSGAGESRNIGINEATGDNLMFLDSDDYYPSNEILEKLYNIKKEFNVKIAGGKHQILSNGNFEEPYFNYGDINQFFCNKTVKYTDYQFPWWYWCFMYDSDLIKNNNFLFPRYLRYQDPPFYVRVMHKAGIFYAADFISYIHRNSNKLFSMNEKQAYDHVNGIKDLLEFSDNNNLNKLHSLLYNTFYSYDINILKNIKNLKDTQIQYLSDLINQSANRDKIY